jgi:release factor glutamine methyltransferase
MASSAGLGVVRADLTAGIRGEFDLVLFNPPYLPTKPGERMDDWLEKALDGGESGRRVIEGLVPDLPRILAPGGRVLMVLSKVTGVGEVLALLRDAGFSAGVVREERAEGEELVVLKAVYKGEPGHEGQPKGRKRKRQGSPETTIPSPVH